MDSERTEEYLEAIYKEQSKGESASTSFFSKRFRGITACGHRHAEKS